MGKSGESSGTCGDAQGLARGSLEREFGRAGAVTGAQEDGSDSSDEDPGTKGDRG